MSPSRSAVAIIPACARPALSTWQRRHNVRKFSTLFEPPSLSGTRWSMCACSNGSMPASQQYGPWQRPTSRAHTCRRISAHSSRGGRRFLGIRVPFETAGATTAPAVVHPCSAVPYLAWLRLARAVPRLAWPWTDHPSMVSNERTSKRPRPICRPLPTPTSLPLSISTASSSPRLITVRSTCKAISARHPGEAVTR